MSDQSNREVVERYAKALPGDFEVLAELRHPEFVEEYPQSRERIVGHERYRKMHESFPGGLPQVETARIIGSEDRLVLTPSFIPVRVLGSGDFFTAEAVNTYPDGSEYYVTALVELRDGKIWRQRTYFAPPFEAPAWRAELVERY
jgi:hypothetical protein